MKIVTSLITSKNVKTKDSYLTLLRSAALGLPVSEEASGVPLYNSLTVYDAATKYINNNLLMTFNDYRMLNKKENFNNII